MLQKDQKVLTYIHVCIHVNNEPLSDSILYDFYDFSCAFFLKMTPTVLDEDCRKSSSSNIQQTSSVYMLSDTETNLFVSLRCSACVRPGSTNTTGEAPKQAEIPRKYYLASKSAAGKTSCFVDICSVTLTLALNLDTTYSPALCPAAAVSCVKAASWCRFNVRDES